MPKRDIGLNFLNMMSAQSMPYKKLGCVMLIDDDGVANFSNYRLLKKVQITENLHFFPNAVDALHFIKSYASENQQVCPELLFLDIEMPYINGFDFMEQLSKLSLPNATEVRIIAMINSNDTANKAILEEKNIEYLVKPITESKLAQLLKKS